MSQKQTTNLIKSETIAENTMAFTFKRPADFAYRAGQTIDLSISTDAGESLTHTLSLVSAPTDNDLVVATRIRDSKYKQILKDLTPEDEVTIAGPYGSFFLHQDTSKVAAFLVGGIGITPFMSLIKDAIATKKPHKLVLFYSNRRPEDAAFLSELSNLGADENNNLTFIPTMTNLSESTQDWSGATGYVDWALISKHIENPDNTVFYAAGPATMVEAMRKLLTANSINEDFIRTEEFSGY